MNIVFIGLKYEYGNPANGYSFEYEHFFRTLQAMEGGRHTVELFAIDEQMRERGRAGLNNHLVQKILGQRPDLCFFFLFTDEIYPTTIRRITAQRITTFNWFADDQWRWYNFSRQYAPCFTWCATTDERACELYRKSGMSHVFLTQWAVAQTADQIPEVGAITTDVSFVGQAYGQRIKMVKNLKHRGIDVVCYGKGWERGRISHEKMREVFQSSLISLNFAAASAVWSFRSLARIFAHYQQGELVASSPLAWYNNARSELARLTRPQIKGRVFEIPGAGGFLLTQYVPGIERFYTPGRDIAVFSTIDEMVECINYYRSHPEEAYEIRVRGYERTRKEHTYEQRFKNIFNAMKLT